jgi:hypothetical protein
VELLAYTSWRSHAAQKDRILVANPFFIGVFLGSGCDDDDEDEDEDYGKSWYFFFDFFGVGNGKRVGEEGGG